MNLRLVDDLACPLCSNSLVLDGASQPQVEQAGMTCTGCGADWSIPPRRSSARPSRPHRRRGENGVGVRMAVEALFGMHPEFEAQFLDWIHPLGA